MGEPVTTGLVIAAVVGAAMSAYASVRSAQQQAEVAKATERQRELESQAVRESAAFEERQARRRALLLQSQQRATTAAAGFETTSGLPLAHEMDLVQQAELEALSIRRAGIMASSEREFEAALARYRAGTARRAVPWLIGAGVVKTAAAGFGAYSQLSPRGGTPTAGKSVTSEWVAEY